MVSRTEFELVKQNLILNNVKEDNTYQMTDMLPSLEVSAHNAPVYKVIYDR
jgi:hypothetical protein